MKTATFKKHVLKFISPGGTSRGILKEKDSWILKISADDRSGYGEVSIIPGLSMDDASKIEEKLKWVCSNINLGEEDLVNQMENFPAICFAIEQAFLDLSNGGNRILFDTPFAKGEEGIKINGLVWMNLIEKMEADAKQKVKDGFSCIKFKIGALDWESELNFLKLIRKTYGNKLEIRVDANGAFNEANVFKMMYELEKLAVHSIEQPIKPGQYELMRKICASSEVRVALDEELIGIAEDDMNELLSEIKPTFLILKPSLLGGFSKSDAWIEAADENNCQWWATSALESNLGLNGIAQWVSSYELSLRQGLGTGSLYSNNFASPLELRKETLFYNLNKKWELPF